MDEENSYLTSLHVNLRDKNNASYRGQLLLKNWTLWYGEGGNLHAGPDSNAAADVEEDSTGASYYVVAVVLVYGMSIVMLIASHINRKHNKLIQDKQIDKYLQEFQIVKEKSSQESYKDLKRKIKEQIQWDKEHSAKSTNKYLQMNLSHAVLPMIAVTFPSIADAQSLTSLMGDAPRSRASSISRSSIAPSSPMSQPRSRRNSISEIAGVHRPSHFLHVPEQHEIASSPRLSRERRKGVSTLFQGYSSKGVDAHHLEKILEESLDSRHSSFRHRNSKKSTRSTSLTSVSETQKNLMRNGVDYPRRASEACDSVINLEFGDNATSSEGPNSPDSGVGNNSNSNTPDVEIHMPDLSHLCVSSDDEHCNSDEYLQQNENIWVHYSDIDTIHSDEDEQRDEAYISGRYSNNRVFNSSPVSLTSSNPNRNSLQSSNSLQPSRYSTRTEYNRPHKYYRLSPLHDESEFYTDSSSDSEDDGLLHVTCV